MTAQAAAATDCRSLFVYGTLRRGFRLHHYLVRLGASFQMEARVAAELFDLGSYPGARPAQGSGQWVRGELFQLPQPATDLKVLDRVEDFNATAPERGKFIRDLAEVILATGARQLAWVYWLGTNAGAGRRIAQGDYAKWRSRDCTRIPED